MSNVVCDDYDDVDNHNIIIYIAITLLEYLGENPNINMNIL